MDTFMDKLSQRLNAQEMIRANGAAEAEEMALLRTKVKEYQGCLDQMQQVCSNMASLENQFAALTDREMNSGNEEMLSSMREELAKMAQDSSEQLGRMQEEISGKLGNMGTEDALHKEGVRLYRNFQGALQEENSKLTETVAAQTKMNRKKINAVLGVSIAALVISVAGVVLQVLGILGVI